MWILFLPLCRLIATAWYLSIRREITSGVALVSLCVGECGAGSQDTRRRVYVGVTPVGFCWLEGRYAGLGGRCLYGGGVLIVTGSVVGCVGGVGQGPSIPEQLLRRFVTGNTSAVPRLSGNVKIDLPAAAGTLGRLVKRKLIERVKGGTSSTNQVPVICSLRPATNCFINIGPRVSYLTLTIDSFYNGLVARGRGIPCICRGAPRDLTRVKGVVGIFVSGLPVGERRVLRIYIGMTRQIEPVRKETCGVFAFLRRPLTRGLAGLLRLPAYVRGSSHDVACKRFVGKYYGNGGSIVFIGVY